MFLAARSFFSATSVALGASPDAPTPDSQDYSMFLSPPICYSFFTANTGNQLYFLRRHVTKHSVHIQIGE